MKESTTYQAILEEGREVGREEGREEGRTEEARNILLRLGRQRFGTPSDTTRTAIEAIISIERLEQLTDRLLSVENWDELMASS